MAFFIKISIYLFHLFVWLPKAHGEAPVYGSIALAGVLLKIGRYGLIRLIEIYYKVGVKYGYIIFRVKITGKIIVGVLVFSSGWYKKNSNLFIRSSYKFNVMEVNNFL